MWSKFLTSDGWISCFKTRANITLSNVNFSSTRNGGDSFRVIFLRFVYFIFIGTCLAYRSVKCKVRPYSSKAFLLFAPTISVAILKICFHFIAPPVAVIQIKIFLTFLIRLSSRRFNLPALLKTALMFLHLAFQKFTIVLLKVYLLYLVENWIPLMTEAFP